jgi:hypothetical protein
MTESLPSSMLPRSVQRSILDLELVRLNAAEFRFLHRFSISMRLLLLASCVLIASIVIAVLSHSSTVTHAIVQSIPMAVLIGGCGLVLVTVRSRGTRRIVRSRSVLAAAEYKIDYPEDSVRRAKSPSRSSAESER